MKVWRLSLLVLALFWTLSVVFFLSLKISKHLKVTVFRRMDLPSSSDKKWEKPILLEPADRAISDLWVSCNLNKFAFCFPLLHLVFDLCIYPLSLIPILPFFFNPLRS